MVYTIWLSLGSSLLPRRHLDVFLLPGNQGSPTVMRRIGQEIAADLKKDNVEGVLFVAT